MKNFLIPFLLFLMIMPAAGQVKNDKPLRVEVPAKGDDESHRIRTCGDKGVVLFFKSIEKVHDTLSKWYFSFYDKDLKQRWVKSVPVPDNMGFFTSVYEQETASFCFIKGAKEKGSAPGMLVLRLNTASGEFSVRRAAIPEKAEPADFFISGSKIFFGYNSKNEIPGVVILDASSGTASGFTWGNGVPSVLTGFRVDTTAGMIYGYLKKSYAKNKYEFFISPVDFSGKAYPEILINDQSLNNGSDNYILDVETFPLNDHEMIAYGAYRSGITKSQEKNNLLTPATGIYFQRILDGKIIHSSFNNFLMMNHAVFPGKSSDVETLQKKASKKNKQLSDYSLDYSVLIHPLIPYRDNKFLMLAELYTPQFHMENYTNFDYYGRPSTNSYRVFDGYRYTNGMILNFDQDGNIIWDNGLEIVSLTTMDLDQKINLSFTPDSLQTLSYLSQGKIGYKVLDKDKVVEKLDFIPLEMMNPEDKLITESKSNMIPWYGNNFLCYGYQEIKNINASENKKRIVFFLTKVKAD